MLCRNIPCHYDALTENQFVANRITTESMLPTLKPTEVVGIIMAHNKYQDHFLDAVTVDLESFCSSKLDILGIENAWIDDGHNVEDKFPEVCKYFFTDPVEKIMTITSFHNNIVTEEYLSNHHRMASGLRIVLNTILTKTKIFFKSQLQEKKDWKVAMRKS